MLTPWIEWKIRELADDAGFATAEIALALLKKEAAETALVNLVKEHGEPELSKTLYLTTKYFHITAVEYGSFTYTPLLAARDNMPRRKAQEPTEGRPPSVAPLPPRYPPV